MGEIDLFGVSEAVLTPAVSAAVNTPLGLIELAVAADVRRLDGFAPVAFRVSSDARVLVW